MIEKLKQNKKLILAGVMLILIIIVGCVLLFLGGEKEQSINESSNIDTGINGQTSSGMVDQVLPVSGENHISGENHSNLKSYESIIREDTNFSSTNRQDAISINVQDLLSRIQTSQQTSSEQNSNFRLKDYTTGGYIGIVVDVKTNDSENPNGKVYLTLSGNVITQLAIATRYENGGMTLPNGRGKFEITNKQSLLSYLLNKPIGDLYTTDKNGATVPKGGKLIILNATYNTGFFVPYLNIVIDYETIFEGKKRNAKIDFSRFWYLSNEGIKDAGNGINIGLAPEEVNEIIEDNIVKNTFGNEKDLKEAFVTCKQYKYSTPSLFGSMYVYEIIGPKTGGCEIRHYYIRPGENEYDDMYCIYDNKLSLEKAGEKVINNERGSCIGPLADKYKE